MKLSLNLGITVMLLLSCAPLNLPGVCQSPPMGASSSAQSTFGAATLAIGTWCSGKNTFTIRARNSQTLTIQFVGLYEYGSISGRMANVGSAAGTAVLVGDTAVFRPEPRDTDCRITLKFQGNQLVVTQAGDCGMGLNVSAAGTYDRVR